MIPALFPRLLLSWQTQQHKRPRTTKVASNGHSQTTIAQGEFSTLTKPNKYLFSKKNYLYFLKFEIIELSILAKVLQEKKIKKLKCGAQFFIYLLWMGSFTQFWDSLGSCLRVPYSVKAPILGLYPTLFRHRLDTIGSF